MSNSLLELYDLAEQHNIEVICIDDERLQSLSIMDKYGDCGIAINPTLLKSSSDETVKLAHEIGHCLTGAFYNRYSPFSIKSKSEYKADKWAIKKLLPQNELEVAIRSGQNLWGIAEHFNVTEDLIKKAIWIYFDKEFI